MVLVTAALAACGQAGATPATFAPSSAAASSTAAPTIDTLDACTLLTQQEVDAASGHQLSAGTHGQPPTKGECDFNASDGNSGVSLILQGLPQPGTPFAQQAQNRAREERAPVAPEQVSGIGDDAYALAFTLQNGAAAADLLVLTKKGEFDVSAVFSGGNAATQLAWCEQLARQVAPRLVAALGG